ncbi:MAG: hypothetical protein UV78_C0013G0005 [Parcubacteria group bacterium GW2011_GWA2_43_17]|nr:MAG: hypothetical protein UV78_C0013G0005 [Parcubacteria group bacterium GW2011_GWA2_43_17]KKT93696.1 MAG: hypothetical protein UW91_C0008G0015 [Parcubacteria group bacterium GW2011_GWF2_45_11]KKT98274.1 MAG: hypothetical protein UW98_C0009G0015 [Parcubacteria group bacterium GW2011_GWC2_45_15]OGY93225.1 MAG: hypothetical protein A2260_03995 [Candidatus Komeilibacteria bacterium RIFOXYA2_FULL_45_9]OGY93326.1 MAG: hypothetical protein A3J95_03030 [Candidatus Komeilibacteria bacterium RIFOXYC2
MVFVWRGGKLTSIKQRQMTYFKAVKIVFRQAQYICLAVFVAVAVFLVSLWLPSLDLLRFIVASDFLSFLVKLKIFWGTLGLLQTNFSAPVRVVVIGLSALSGLNAALLVFYLKRRIVKDKAGGLGFIGIFSGLLGLGCLACGSVVLTSLIGFSATAVFIGWLPFGAQEFGWLGLILLLISIHLIIKKIQNPDNCKIN